MNLCELTHTSCSGNLSHSLGLLRYIQELPSGIHAVSQATISRALTVHTPLIAEASRRGCLR